MRNRIQAALVVAILLVLAGLFAPAVRKVHEAAARSHCQNNLRSLALALQNYESCYGGYPHGTVAGTDLPPRRRLSGYVELWPFVQGGWRWLLDLQKPWDDEANCPTRADCKVSDSGRRITYEERVIGELPVFLCPSNPHGAASDSPSYTHYVGVAGVGEDAAGWPLEHVCVGVYGYDRAVRSQDIEDGQASTLALIETAKDNGPWTAGGSATVRSLIPDVPPYLGRDGQLGALHRGVNAAFLDGTVRNLSITTDPCVLEALATISGGERIESDDY